MAKLSEKGRKGCLRIVLFFVLVVLAIAFLPRIIKSIPAIAERLSRPTAIQVIEQPTKVAQPTSQQAIKPTSTSTPQATLTKPMAIQPTAMPVAVRPTETLVPSKPTTPVKREKLVLACDAFGSYFPGTQVDQMENRSYDIEMIPFLFDGEGGKYDIKEGIRAKNLASGEWDILFTTDNSLARFGNVGVIVAWIDQSAGADKVVAWPNAVTVPGRAVSKFNDLSGLTITYSEGSVGHYQVLALLRVVGLTTNNVKMLPASSVAEAVQFFIDKKADAVAGWEPDITKAIDAGGKELVSSDWWRNIGDVILVSNKANTEKHDLIMAFLHDWFVAIKQQQENLDEAAKIIAAWEFEGQPTNDWTFVYPDTATDDLKLWLGTIAQAGLSVNSLIMRELTGPMSEQLQTMRQIWEWGLSAGSLPPFDFRKAIEPSYVLALANDSTLKPSGGQFVNPSFQPLMAKVPKADPEVLITLPAIAELPCKDFQFPPEIAVLERGEFNRLQSCSSAMVQMLATSEVNMLITGGSAWPEINYRTGKPYTRQEIEDFARQRALMVYTALVSMGVDEGRMAINTRIPDAFQKWEQEMKPYREVIIEAKRAGR